MGSCIIKAARDVDLYCVWSSIVEAPTFIGTREETRRHIGGNAEERLARADEVGTSMTGWDRPGDCPVSSLVGSWEYGGLIVEQRGTLPRHLMEPFLLAYAENPQDAYAFLEPFEDEETEGASGV